MVRIQVQLTERQIRELLRISARTGQSVAALVRQGVDRYLAGEREKVKRAIRVAEKFSSGISDVSTDHDKHLAKAFRQ